MEEPMVTEMGKKCLKRKRISCDSCLSKEERESRIGILLEEVNGLYKYFMEVRENTNKLKKKMDLNFSSCIDSVIACLMEGSNLPLSKLVDEIYEKVKKRQSNVSLSSVRSSVLLNGQRSMYGLPIPDVDVLEDDSESCLWCWEARDIKLIPKSMCGALKIWRTCRKKITERINAVSAMIAALQKSESDQICRQVLTKASKRLGKVSSEADIRLLISNMVQKKGVERAEKEGKQESNTTKQIEKSKCGVEQEEKRIVTELQKEKQQSEEELKRLQDEADKEQKHREKDESESRKQLKRQQEEAEKDQRHRQKEEAELKKQHALQKQASLMERFLMKGKEGSPVQKGPSLAKSINSDSFANRNPEMIESVILSMDSALSQHDGINSESIWRLHLNSWRHLGHLIRLNGKQHWGIRQTPKMELIKELKLTTSRQTHYDNELNLDKLVCGETNSNCRLCQTNAECSCHTGPKRKRKKQLLQFDRSHRPAFYGSWPNKSDVIGPRHPFVKDPDLDYEIDSDEEWEEEEPGENLSDCDKDDEEESVEGPSKSKDDSEDGFFVPDGYLSENEGVDDGMESEDVDEARTSSSSCELVESEELRVFSQQQKHLHSLTEHALRKNRPLIISNLKQVKRPLVLAEDLNGTSEIVQTCLLALSIRVFPGFPSIEISNCVDVQEENLDASPSSSKGNTTSAAAATAILEKDLPQFVSVIQSSYAESINKVTESLQLKFPSISRAQLRNKVREISDFTDNRWLVRKDILNKLGLSPYPEKTRVKTKHIATFFSKRCLPPADESQNPKETLHQSSSRT